MSTIYIPRRIETAEQAEALPEGTIIIHAENYPQEKFAGLWGRAGNSSQQLADEEGWSALVPIEAEEEWTAMGEDSDGDPWIAHVGHGGIDGTREEAEAYVRRFGGFIAHRALTLWEAQD